MNLYLHEWPDKTVILMLENGKALFNFNSITNALAACDGYYNTVDRRLVINVDRTQDLSCSTLA